jgi:hypothetical protein
MATARGLNVSIENRLRNQIGRAFRQTFAAEQGLRVLTRDATAQMLACGMSRSTIQDVLWRLVTEHPEAGSAKPLPISGESRAKALASSVLSWSDATNTKASA